VTASTASSDKPKPMTATQLKHLKEKIELIKKDLRRKFLPEAAPMPPEVRAAEQLVQQWRDESWKEQRKNREEIGDQIDAAGLNIIDTLLFPDPDIKPFDLLKQLEAWTPPTPALPPVKGRGKK
jgi:hypothetical protein